MSAIRLPPIGSGTTYKIIVLASDQLDPRLVNATQWRVYRASSTDDTSEIFPATVANVTQDSYDSIHVFTDHELGSQADELFVFAMSSTDHGVTWNTSPDRVRVPTQTHRS